MTPKGEAQPKSVLVIDDDEGIRETLKIVLEVGGYTVFAAENGEEGIDLLRKISKPCLILLDLMMPVMNGWEFLDAIRKDSALATIPVVIVSAYAEQAANIKAQGVIQKPVDVATLMKAIEGWCNLPDRANT